MTSSKLFGFVSGGDGLQAGGGWAVVFLVDSDLGFQVALVLPVGGDLVLVLLVGVGSGLPLIVGGFGGLAGGGFVGFGGG